MRWIVAKVLAEQHGNRGLAFLASARGALAFKLAKLGFVVDGITFKYARPITITEQSGDNLTDYPTAIDLDSTNFDFSHTQSNGADVRFTDSNGNLLDYFIEEWDATNESAKVWVKVPSIPANSSTVIYIYYGNSEAESASDGDPTFSFFDHFEEVPPDYYKFSVSSTDHNNYGLSYPITYEFIVPPCSSNLKAYKKYTEDGSWTEIIEKTSDDFFNGIEAVRFDYENNVAYVSVAFDANSDDLYLKIVDEQGNSVGIYSQISKYYDNRKCAVTCSVDEWDDCSTSYECGEQSKFGEGARTTCDECRKRHLWVSVGIVTKGRDNGGEPNWSDIQEKIDAGYFEPVSHSRTHADAEDPDFDADSEVGGSRDDIINNLNLPALNKKGSTEYVYAYLEPFGHSSSACRQKLGEYHYLCDRDITTDNDFASWDSDNGLYNRIGYSIRIGIDGTTDLSSLNSAFDEAYNNGKIYHLMWHSPQETTSGCWGVDYTEGSYFHQHLDYIKEKKDVWYVAFGHLYLYHYVKDRNIISVTPYGGSTDVDSEKWIVRQGDVSVSVTSLLLKGTTGTRGLIDGKTEVSPGSAIHVRAKYLQTNAQYCLFCELRKSNDDDYRLINYVRYSDGLPASWSQNAGDFTVTDWGSVDSPLNWHVYKIFWKSGEAKYYQDNTLKATHSSNIPSINLVAAFEEGTVDGGDVAVDWIFIRKFVEPEPSVSIGSETRA